MASRDLVLSAAGSIGDSKTYVEDVFSTYLYTGNGSTQTITNGIDLAGKGGMVWCKSRSNSPTNQLLYDTQRGALNAIRSHSTGAQVSYSETLTSFNANGFSLGTDVGGANINESAQTYASWTFRKAPKFFDVVTYTGNGAASKVISHSLGAVPGMIITKSTTVANNWWTYHRSVGNTAAMRLQTTDASLTASTLWNDTSPTESNFTVGVSINETGQTYVAYLFAHDTTADGLIQCGTFTGNGTVDFSGLTVNLGWEPQYVLMKQTNGNSDWLVFDNMRGTPVDRSGAARTSPMLAPNLSSAEQEYSPSCVAPNPTGFTVNNAFISNSPKTWIYMAIRRPMKVPTDGTTVFSPNITSATLGTKITTGFPIDLQINARRATYAANSLFLDRLRGVSTNATQGANYLVSSSTAAEVASTTSYANFWDNTGYLVPSSMTGVSNVTWNFKRATGFFDVVCYTGTGVARTVNHNLGVAPELMIVKRRDAAGYGWEVYPNNPTKVLELNSTAAATSYGGYWNSTAPTSTVFSLGASEAYVNGSGGTYVAYLFASCPGVSKVGSYTGNGSSQTINCGFTNGARFVMVKRTDSTGDWFVWDTARGVVAANDPRLSLNSIAAEVTTTDWIDPDPTGFVVNYAVGSFNGPGDTYIYLAIA